MTDPQPPVPPIPSPDGAVPPPAAPSAEPPTAPPPPTAYPAYGQPAAAGYYAPPTNTLAIVSLVLAFIISIGGIICGHIALAQIKRTGEGGRGLAIAGLIIGYVFTGFWVLYFLFIIIFVVIAIPSMSMYG